MGKAYKNFWSLNTDEAVVAGILRNETNKNVEVFMPLNAQMKDIDLMLLNTRNGNSLTLQIKGSRAFEPKKSEIREYLFGSAGWFFFPREAISDTLADWFVFLVYVIEQHPATGRRYIEPHVITIPTKNLLKLVDKYKQIGKTGKYNFLLWVDPKRARAFDFHDKKFDLTKYLDKNGFRALD